MQYVFRKPITHKGKKAILKKEPKLIEDAKEALCLKGNRTSQIVTDIMKDLVSKYNFYWRCSSIFIAIEIFNYK